MRKASTTLKGIKQCFFCIWSIAKPDIFFLSISRKRTILPRADTSWKRQSNPGRHPVGYPSAICFDLVIVLLIIVTFLYNILNNNCNNIYCVERLSARRGQTEPGPTTRVGHIIMIGNGGLKCWLHTQHGRNLHSIDGTFFEAESNSLQDIVHKQTQKRRKTKIARGTVFNLFTHYKVKAKI